MKKNLLILAAILFLPTACNVCVGQANVGGVNNNACCSTKELVIISKDNKGENTIVNQNPSASPVPSVSPSSGVVVLPSSTSTPLPIPSQTPSPSSS